MVQICRLQQLMKTKHLKNKTMRLKYILSPDNPKFITWLFLVMFFMILIAALHSCNTTNKHKSLSKSTTDSAGTSVYDSAKTSSNKSVKLSIIDSSKFKRKVTKNGVTIEFEKDSPKDKTGPITIEKKDGKTIIDLGGRIAKRITETDFKSNLQVQKAIVADKAVTDIKDSSHVSKNTNVDLHKKEVTKTNDKSTHRFSWWWIIPVVVVAGVLVYLKFKKV